MQLHTVVHTMAGELDPFGWTICTVLALNPDFLIVVPMQLGHTTVVTMRMQLLAVRFSVSNPG